MKKIVLINGTIGIGKTTISSELLDSTNNSVMLDGDWAWYQGNEWNFSNSNKDLAVDNINYCLCNFIKSKNFNIIIFCWVMFNEKYKKAIIEALDETGIEYNLYDIVLNGSLDTIKWHLEKRMKNRNGLYEESVMSSLADESYEKQSRIIQISKNSHMISVDNKKEEEIVNSILNYIGEENTTSPVLVKH